MIDSCTTTNVVGVARSVVGVAPSVVGVAINGDVVANNVVEAATRNGEGGIALKERHWWEGADDSIARIPFCSI